MADSLRKLDSAASLQPLFLADHPALDMLNTVAVIDAGPVDFWHTDTDVLDWLKYQDMMMVEAAQARWPQGTLVAAAGRLRELVRELVIRRKVRRWPVGIEPLNAFLARGASHLEICEGQGKALRIVRRYAAETPEAVLAPLAESAAELLVEGDFDLVRRCAGQGCVLWFYDRTKAHRRRWCSMGICGNRAKVAAFRKRSQS